MESYVHDADTICSMRGAMIVNRTYGIVTTVIIPMTHLRNSNGSERDMTRIDYPKGNFVQWEIGHVMDVLKTFPDKYFSTVVTSPPYLGLRDYQTAPLIWGGSETCQHQWGEDITIGMTGGKQKDEDSYGPGRKFEQKLDFCSKCNAWKGQLGLEPTPELFISHLCDIFDIVWDKLRDDGTIWVNLGDSYAGSTGATGGKGLDTYKKEAGATSKPMRKTNIGYPSKCLLMIPQRFAIEMINRGWILRNTIIWHKKSCMPSSVKDRFTVDFEYIYFFAKSSKTQYWINETTAKIVNKKPSGIDGIEDEDWEWKAEQSGKKKKRTLWSGHDYFFEQQFEPMADATKQRDNYKFNGVFKGQFTGSPNEKRYQNTGYKIEKPSFYNELGRNARTTWAINPQPYSEAHFAVFPKKLVETPLKAGCPTAICTKCGLPRKKIYKSNSPSKAYADKDGLVGAGSPMKTSNPQSVKSLHRQEGGVYSTAKFQGYSDCGCGAPFEPGVALDPFLGSGTTAEVARELGLSCVGIELNPDYEKFIKKRLLGGHENNTTLLQKW